MTAEEEEALVRVDEDDEPLVPHDVEHDEPEEEPPDFFRKFHRFSPTWKGSFSAVSKPIFATKYSFCSIFRDLQDFHISHCSKLKILLICS